MPCRKYRLFLSAAGWLQATVGSKPIYLPTRKLASILEVSRTTVSRWREAGVQDGFLKKTRDHSLRDRRATEYSFAVWRFPILQQAAAKPQSQVGGPSA